MKFDFNHNHFFLLSAAIVLVVTLMSFGGWMTGIYDSSVATLGKN